jgi:hypothetical protein
MSGGHYDYAYGHIERLADDIITEIRDFPERHSRGCITLRIAFAMHLLMVARAARAIEWVDSGDDSEDTDLEHISNALAAASNEHLKLIEETSACRWPDLQRILAHAMEVKDISNPCTKCKGAGRVDRYALDYISQAQQEDFYGRVECDRCHGTRKEPE